MPLRRLAVEVDLDDVCARHALLQFDRRAQRDELAVIDDRDAVAERIGFIHVVSGDEHRKVARFSQVVEHLVDSDA